MGGCFFGHEAGRQPCRGVLGHQRPQVGCDPRALRGCMIADVADHATNALCVLGFVERQKHRQMPSGTRVNQVDGREIPASYTQPQLDERAVGRGNFEAHALHGDGAIATPLHPRDFGAEGASKPVGVWTFAPHARPAQVALERCLLDLGVLLVVVLVLDPSLRCGV